MKKVLPLIIVLAVLVGAGAFYGGMQYTKSQRGGRAQDFRNLSPEERQARGQQFSGASAGIRGAGGRERGNMIRGEILASDKKSVTVKLSDGGSRIIFLSEITEITKQAQGSRDDLTVGATVFVQGDQNPDGSVIANTIQLAPRVDDLE